MPESMGNPHPIDAPLTPVSDVASFALTTYVKTVDRFDRFENDLGEMRENNRGLLDALDEFTDGLRVPEELENAFAEGYTLAYSLLSIQASYSDTSLPNTTGATIGLYFKQIPFKYKNPNDFYIKKTEEVELGDEDGNYALERFLDYYIDELSGLDRCAVVFGFVALYDIVDYCASTESTNEAYIKRR
jgi:hypothetical protein